MQNNPKRTPAFESRKLPQKQWQIEQKPLQTLHQLRVIFLKKMTFYKLNVYVQMSIFLVSIPPFFLLLLLGLWCLVIIVMSCPELSVILS